MRIAPKLPIKMRSASKPIEVGSRASLQYVKQWLRASTQTRVYDRALDRVARFYLTLHALPDLPADVMRATTEAFEELMEDTSADAQDVAESLSLFDFEIIKALAVKISRSGDALHLLRARYPVEAKVLASQLSDKCRTFDDICKILGLREVPFENIDNIDGSDERTIKFPDKFAAIISRQTLVAILDPRKQCSHLMIGATRANILIDDVPHNPFLRFIDDSYQEFGGFDRIKVLAIGAALSAGHEDSTQHNMEMRFVRGILETALQALFSEAQLQILWLPENTQAKILIDTVKGTIQARLI